MTCFRTTETIEKAEHYLGNRTYNMNVTEYEDMILDCEYDILVTAKFDSPGSRIAWLKDGFKISDPMKLGDIDLYETKLSNEQKTTYKPHDNLNGIFKLFVFRNRIYTSSSYRYIHVHHIS